MKRMRPPVRLDTTASRVAHALSCAARPKPESDRRGLEKLIAKRWLTFEDSQVVGVSVRSLFDAYLDALWRLDIANHTGRTKVIVSEITHPEMVDILEFHGFDVAFVPVNKRTLSPDLEDLSDMMGPEVFAVLIADLFGGRARHNALHEVAERHGALYWQDCAQGLRHVGEWGFVEADAVFWSFGPLKSVTCFGGGLARIPDHSVSDMMHSIINGYQTQPTKSFAKKAALIGSLLPLMHPAVYGAVEPHIRSLKPRLMEALKASPGREKLHQKPCMALLEHMAEVFSGSHAGDISLRREAGEKLMARLGDFDWAVMGAEQDDPTYWMVGLEDFFPSWLDQIRAAGWDVMDGVSSVKRMDDAGDMHFIPMFPDATDEELEALAWAIRTADRREKAERQAWGDVIGGMMQVTLAAASYYEAMKDG